MVANRIKMAVFAVLAATTLTSALAAPAHAVDEVVCNDQSIKVSLMFEDVCFANPGTKLVNLEGVYSVSSGRHRVAFQGVLSDGREETITLEPKQSRSGGKYGEWSLPLFRQLHAIHVYIS